MSVSRSSRVQLHRLNDPRGFLLFLSIDSPYLSAPVRVVRDTRNRTVGGVDFQALPFEITLPQDAQKEHARSQIEMDNVGRDVLGELEALPVGEALDVTLRIASRATPEMTDYEFTGAMSKATATYGKIAIAIGDDALFRMPAVLLRYDSETAPGLFAG